MCVGCHGSSSETANQYNWWVLWCGTVEVRQQQNLKYFSSLHLFFLLEQGLAPLCENMPSGKATKPGDVVTAKNGKTIQVGKQLLRCEAVRICRERLLCLCVG